MAKWIISGTLDPRF